eukprot:TRINITY_DN13182_c0_g1_i1.p1 TRINITY_DN13182_c0_g1~~TRINITY_DN13182_c0_g1_i1.p1  ORF type:complete len:264 (+),score=78.11 TRINITY_DN13182_c0_g1_i1:62-853(+)
MATALIASAALGGGFGFLGGFLGARMAQAEEKKPRSGGPVRRSRGVPAGAPQALRKVFARADTDRDGKLSQADLLQQLKTDREARLAFGMDPAGGVAAQRRHVADIMKACDSDGDGKVTLAEMAAPTSPVRKAAPLSPVRRPAPAGRKHTPSPVRRPLASPPASPQRRPSKGPPPLAPASSVRSSSAPTQVRRSRAAPAPPPGLPPARGTPRSRPGSDVGSVASHGSARRQSTPRRDRPPKPAAKKTGAQRRTAPRPPMPSRS